VRMLAVGLATQVLGFLMLEPPRVRWRLFCLGHAARAAGSNWV